MTAPTPDRCGHTVVDGEGIEQPCDRAATGWRWYQDVEHEDCLEPACDRHANEGGRRMHAAEAALARVEAEVHHAADNGHILDRDCQGVAPGERVPAVRLAYIRAALNGAEA
jgi:hypothetical protein